MEFNIWWLLISIGALIIGMIVGYILRKNAAEKKIGSAEEQARKLLEDAIRNAESAKKEAVISAKDEIFNREQPEPHSTKRRRSSRIVAVYASYRTTVRTGGECKH